MKFIDRTIKMKERIYKALEASSFSISQQESSNPLLNKDAVKIISKHLDDNNLEKLMMVNKYLKRQLEDMVRESRIFLEINSRNFVQIFLASFSNFQNSDSQQSLSKILHRKSIKLKNLTTNQVEDIINILAIENKKISDFETPFAIKAIYLNESPEFSKEELLRLLSFLPNLSHLTDLSLRDKKIEVAEARILAELLKINKSLVILDLTYNKIKEEGAQAIAEALKSNTTLTVLGLANNRIGNAGAKSLAKSLEKNSAITVLDISRNQIENRGVSPLAQSIKENTTLAVIDLAYNQIGTKGARSLAQALKKNITLEILELTYNKIGNKGIEALADSLKTNIKLNTLNVVGNEIKNKGAAKLAESLKFNTTLTNLGINGIIDLTIQNRLNQTLKRNKKIAKFIKNSIAYDEQDLAKAINFIVRKDEGFLATSEKKGLGLHLQKFLKHSFLKIVSNFIQNLDPKDEEKNLEKSLEKLLEKQPNKENLLGLLGDLATELSLKRETKNSITDLVKKIKLPEAFSGKQNSQSNSFQQTQDERNDRDKAPSNSPSSTSIYQQKFFSRQIS